MTRTDSSCRVQTNKSGTQEQNNLYSGRGYGADSGSVSTVGSDLETGRTLSRPIGLGLDQMGPSPSESNRPCPDGLISSGHKGFETTFAGGGTGLNQGYVLRLHMPSIGRVSIPSESNIAEEGNKDLSREEGEIREDQPQDVDCVHMERYVNNCNDQSLSSRFSVFGRPLLLGDFSGLGVSLGLKIWN